MCTAICEMTRQVERHIIMVNTRRNAVDAQALVSFKKYMPPPLPYFKVNMMSSTLFPIPHFASIFFAYLWSFRWPNYIVTLPRYFSFRLPHLNIPTGTPSDELDKNSRRTRLSENLSHWNGYRETGGGRKMEKKWGRKEIKEKRGRREKGSGRKESRAKERRRGVGEDYPLSSPS